MFHQSQSLNNLQRDLHLKPLQIAARYPESADFNIKLKFFLPQIKKAEQSSVFTEQSKYLRLPQLQNHMASSDQLQSKKIEIRKSSTPKNQRRQTTLYAMRTKAGCQINKATKINQDSAIVCPKILENIGYKLFAVSDGHGLNGHLVSNFIKQTLPKHFHKYLVDNQEDIKMQIARAFTITNREIWNSNTDTNLSGSTTASVLITKDNIYTANVGDSRAILCKFDQIWKIVPLTRDHKPDDPEEMKVIIDAGGRVEQQKDFHGNPIGPFRVWLQYIQAPGLAMSRSFGDKVGAQAGVTAIPEIKEFPLTKHNQFIIVASDGVWDYMSNEEVMGLVIPYFEKDNPEHAAEKVVKEAIQAWRRNSLARDDITCIVIFL
ncbi:unnamed protein product (macronuclear) [Paramecium tetraurelia]|uniref:PPM-type phosphatase domain-containing protein n=1 Tax=Paramecium tetraurelia TaxID=5888 RepID=A0BL11_PARTE|nr:uncharacterized protein GSPATT00029859001 [Paramecium tetraurelia]CAK59228.1 unnamed protein product [Paramecium tetraurelia]|eukprot:XP_001426626.1 hypothetical protein (macronuclear) [Paramecium tetraurelia strain d4-2]